VTPALDGIPERYVFLPTQYLYYYSIRNISSPNWVQNVNMISTLLTYTLNNYPYKICY